MSWLLVLDGWRERTSVEVRVAAFLGKAGAVDALRGRGKVVVALSGVRRWGNAVAECSNVCVGVGGVSGHGELGMQEWVGWMDVVEGRDY